jgi:hypothetical protein
MDCYTLDISSHFNSLLLVLFQAVAEFLVGSSRQLEAQTDVKSQ